MSVIIIRPLLERDVSQASKLLAQSFLSDQGMRILFRYRDEPTLHTQMEHWFSVTIHMWLNHKMPMFIAMKNEQIVGVILGGKASFNVSGWAQLQWAIKIAFHCGFIPVFRTAQHDAHRRGLMKGPKVEIVEFVAVAPQMRGQRIGQQLFAAYEDAVGIGALIWLETTRQENLSIFNRFGYEKVGQSETMGVVFTQMQKG